MLKEEWLPASTFSVSNYKLNTDIEWALSISDGPVPKISNPSPPVLNSTNNKIQGDHTSKPASHTMGWHMGAFKSADSESADKEYPQNFY